MSLFRDSVRRAPAPAQEAVRRYVEAMRYELEPDPLFRRRLRGRVVNTFVAVHEGIDVPSVDHASRLGHLGRACLYASCVVAFSVTGLMAASQQSLPGDPFYPVKLHIEAMRMDVLPSRYHEQLAAHALIERVTELGRLAESGDWERVTTFAGSVRESYERLLEVADDADAVPQGLLAAQLAVLARVVEDLPPRAQEAIRTVMDGTPGLAPSDHGSLGGTRSPAIDPATSGRLGVQAGSGPSTGAGTAPGERNDEPRRPAAPTSTPDPTATPEPTARPDPTAGPGVRAGPEPTATPEATPEPTPKLVPTAPPQPRPEPGERSKVPSDAGPGPGSEAADDARAQPSELTDD